MEKFTAETPKFNSPEEEIAFLREKIAQKEQALVGQEERPRQQEVVSEEIKQYTKADAQEVLDPAYEMKIDEIEAKVLHFSTEHEEAVDEVVDIMEAKGIKNALSVAEKLGSHIYDDFHRFLVQYLIEIGNVPGLKEGTPIFRALRMKLFQVALPRANDRGEERKFAELVSGMEQFYAGMLSVGDSRGRKKERDGYFTLEIAQSNYKNDIVFYCAVPRRDEHLFEKQLLAIFPDARIDEHKEDYNPFNSGGVTLGAYASAGGSELLPMKAYEAFEQDPLNVLLNGFSGLEREGEGASIQLVFSPVGNIYNKQYQIVLDKLREGATFKDATEQASATLAKEFGGAMKGIIFGIDKKKDDGNKDTTVNEKAVEDVAEKISSPIVSTNIRIIASAGAQERAETILHELEASFNQFDRPDGGSIKWEHPKSKALSQFTDEFTFRLYNKAQNLPLSIREITTMLHFPITAKRAPAPQGISQDGVLLGINEYQAKETEVHFNREDRMRHFYVIGQTGTGKTAFLKNMINQDIANGDGVCMIDPHGSDIEDVLANIPKERIDDVIYFDPAYTERPMGLNMLEYDPAYPEQKTFVVNELFSIFQKLYGGNPESMGPMFEQYFRNSAMLVVDSPEIGNTLMEISRVMTDEKFRELKLSRCKNPVIVQFWREIATKAGGDAALANIVPYITSKFDVFMANDIMRPIIAQEKSAFDFRKIMDERKILLVNLSKGRLGDMNSSLIGLILVGKILMAALSRVNSKERPDFYLYIDEFQNVTTDSISTILSEARKYRLSLNIAHQYIKQLEDGIRDAVFGNVGSMAVFRVGSEDAEFLEKQLAPTFGADDIMNIENFNAYVKLLVGGSPKEPFNMRTMRPQEGRQEVVDKLKELSYIKYGRAREEVEAEIAKKFGS